MEKIQMGNRQTGNLWWYLGFHSWNKWRGWHLFDRRFWARNGFILHDSFGQFWSRWIMCPLRGHRNMKDTQYDDGYFVSHCFDCERSPAGNVVQIVTKNNLEKREKEIMNDR